MIKRPIVCILSLLAAVSLLSGCKKEEEKTVTLVMAEVNQPGTISAKMDLAFKEKVEELSEGKILVELKTGATLGDEETVMNLMLQKDSSIQLERISAFSLTKFGCQKSALLTIPFTFANKEHFWNFAASDFAEEILNEPYEKGLGIKGLFYGEEGFRHFFGVKPLSSTKDFEGINLRITNDVIMQGVAASLKAKTVTVSFAELYSAFRTGKTDAAEQPIANYLGNRFHDVAPYMILDGHSLGVTEVIITAEAWDSLNEKQQKILIEAGKYARSVCAQISNEAEENAKKQLILEGAVFTEVKDITPWQKACEDVIQSASKSAPELYKEIVSLNR